MMIIIFVSNLTKFIKSFIIKITSNNKDVFYFLVCEECQDFYYGECPSHSFKIIEDSFNKTETSPHPDAIKSLPENLYVKNSLIPNAGSGVFTKVKLDMNTRFGPYKGKKVDPEYLEDDMNTTYMWEVCKL